MTMNQRMSVRDVDPEVYKVVGTLNSYVANGTLGKGLCAPSSIGDDALLDRSDGLAGRWGSRAVELGSVLERRVGPGPEVLNDRR
jgi:hypothetical protein